MSAQGCRAFPLKRRIFDLLAVEYSNSNTFNRSIRSQVEFLVATNHSTPQSTHANMSVKYPLRDLLIQDYVDGKKQELHETQTTYWDVPGQNTEATLAFVIAVEKRAFYRRVEIGVIRFR